METQKMKMTLGLIGSGGAVALMSAMSLLAAAYLPADGRYPTHWGLSGQPDAFGSATQLLLTMPFVAVGTTALFALLPYIEPRREHIRQSAKGYQAIWLAVLGVLIVVHLMMILTAFHVQVPIITVIGLALGLMYLVIGNYLGKLRSNFFAGVRTPWTLSSELSWNKTHRLGGRLFMAYGVLTMAAAFLSPPAFLAVTLLGLAMVAPVTIVYSWYIWKHDPARNLRGA
jgi:uncharacterized membrane protein